MEAGHRRSTRRGGATRGTRADHCRREVSGRRRYLCAARPRARCIQRRAGQRKRVRCGGGEASRSGGASLVDQPARRGVGYKRGIRDAKRSAEPCRARRGSRSLCTRTGVAKTLEWPRGAPLWACESKRLGPGRRRAEAGRGGRRTRRAAAGAAKGGERVSGERLLKTQEGPDEEDCWQIYRVSPPAPPPALHPALRLPRCLAVPRASPLYLLRCCRCQNPQKPNSVQKQNRALMSSD